MKQFHFHSETPEVIISSLRSKLMNPPEGPWTSFVHTCPQTQQVVEAWARAMGLSTHYDQVQALQISLPEGLDGSLEGPHRQVQRPAPQPPHSEPAPAPRPWREVLAGGLSWLLGPIRGARARGARVPPAREATPTPQGATCVSLRNE